MNPEHDHALYRFFDQAGRLLYVGISHDPLRRLLQHRSDKPWWTDVSQVTIERHRDRRAVLDAERAAIIAERPVHNVTHNGERPGPLPRPTFTPSFDAHPQVVILRTIDAGHTVVAEIRCPHCNQIHRHGLGPHGTNGGHRVAHCHPTRRPAGYYLVIPGGLR